MFATAVIGGALIFAFLGQSASGVQSPLGWLQFPLIFLLCWGLFTTPENEVVSNKFLSFMGLSWVLGMLVELTLTVDGTGIGGIHPDTLPSFILAQGDYIPLALAIWCLHRWMGSQVHELMWITTGMALTEGIVFTGSVVSALTAGSLLGSFLVSSYLIAIYMVYLVLPFRLLGISRGNKLKGRLLLLAIGFATAFAVRVFWGLIYSPIVSWAFGI